MSTVSPRAPDPAVRTALVETAARLIAAEGSAQLSLRRLAREVGTSTMAVYTHFGSMDELRRAVRLEGFARLGADLAAVAPTDDPVADLVVLGGAYWANATGRPHLYRAMFMEGPVDEADAGTGLETFDHLVRCVGRAVDDGRFTPPDPVPLAHQVWAMTHGVVTLHLAGFSTEDEALGTLAATGQSLFVAFGDAPTATAASLERALARLGPGPAR